MAKTKKGTKKIVEEKEVISKEFKKPKIDIDIEKPKEEKKINEREISYATKKVFKDYILTTIYYKDGTVEERKSTDIRRA